MPAWGEAVRRVGPPAVQTFTRRTLEEDFASPTAAADRFPSPEALPRELVEPFLSWRKSVIVSLIRELVEQVGSGGPGLRPVVSLDPAARSVVSRDPGAEATDDVLASGHAREGSALRTFLAPLIAQVHGIDCTVGFQGVFPKAVGISGQGNDPSRAWDPQFHVVQLRSRSHRESGVDQGVAAGRGSGGRGGPLFSDR